MLQLRSLSFGQSSVRWVLWGAVAVGLLVHARAYDFFADDAFIALRYSEGLLTRGELTYNPGERVEGFTSPLWVLLVALLGLFGGSLVHAAQLLGAACGLGTLFATALLWSRLEPARSPFGAIIVAALLAASPPFAAWTLGGLEAPLFALGLSLALVALADAWSRATPRAWAVCGVACSLASLARPEGMALVAIAGGLVLALAVKGRTPRLALYFAAPVAALLGGYLAFRLVYYGYPLPNTYYVKTSGGSGLTGRGVQYLVAMTGQFGFGFCLALFVALVLPVARVKHWYARLGDRDSNLPLHLMLRVLIVAFLAYIVRIGGDFLDLYRFTAPLLPLALSLIVAALFDAASWIASRPSRWMRRTQVAAGLLGLGLLLDFGRHQLWMGVTASGATWTHAPKNAPKRSRGVESLRWTRLAATQWSALGRALREVRQPEDTMAMGAAGAVPFSSGLPNLDLFGLNDAWVAHHGAVVGTRPGHQRWAGERYIASKKPTFLVLQRNTEGGLRNPKPHKYWAKRGYVTALVKVDKRRHRAAQPFYAEVLVRKQRAAQLEGQDGWLFSRRIEKESTGS